MKTRAFLLSTAIAALMAVALPALASGTGDQRGPACTDIKEVQFQLSEGVVGGVANPNDDPFVEGDEWIAEPTPTGKWTGKVWVRLANAPCDAKGAYAVDLLITGKKSDGASVTDHRAFTVTEFTQKGPPEDPYWEATYPFSIDEAAEGGYEPTGACNKVESIWQQNHIADASPDAGSEGTDSAGRLCGFETESGGARSYGARSYG